MEITGNMKTREMSGPSLPVTSPPWKMTTTTRTLPGTTELGSRRSCPDTLERRP